MTEFLGDQHVSEAQCKVSQMGLDQQSFSVGQPVGPRQSAQFDELLFTRLAAVTFVGVKPRGVARKCHSDRRLRFARERRVFPPGAHLDAPEQVAGS